MRNAAKWSIIEAGKKVSAMPKMKHTAKDSVFSYIFREPENLRQLYLALHPEDTDITEEECHPITLETSSPAAW